MAHTILYTQENYRIIEHVDDFTSIENLKGDCFKPEQMPHLTVEEVKTEETMFERRVEWEGVYGYELQVWNPEVNRGWEFVDSCFGFVGTYEDHNHYIVDEFKAAINQAIEDNRVK